MRQQGTCWHEIASPGAAFRQAFQHAAWLLTGGLLRELNPGPLGPKPRIMPLDQAAVQLSVPSKLRTQCAHKRLRVFAAHAAGVVTTQQHVAAMVLLTGGFRSSVGFACARLCLAEGVIALSVTLSGGALLAS